MWSLKFFANSRLSRLKPISDAMDVLMNDNVSAYKKHLSGTRQEHLIKDCWYINVFRGRVKPDIKDLAWQLRIEHGAPVELVNAGEIREIEPAISNEYHSAVILKDQARSIAPGNLCKALADKALKQGASFSQAALKSLLVNSSGGYDLVTDDGTINARKVVICAGIWSAGLLEGLGIKLPLIAERGYHLEFLDPGVELMHSIQDVEAKIVVSSMLAGIRSAGTSEFAGLNAKPNYKRADILKPLTRRLLPALNISQTQPWMGIRPSLPDNLPVIDRVRELPGLYAAFGHSHFGLGMAPKTGQFIAGLVAGETSDTRLHPYRLKRFA
jgi:D-amino-acid dehydrogenase